MIDEIPTYGEPRTFLNKWTAKDVKELNIRCCVCGSRIQNDDSNVCNVCERMATVIQGE
jgi:hypothetical protein